MEKQSQDNTTMQSTSSFQKALYSFKKAFSLNVAGISLYIRNQWENASDFYLDDLCRDKYHNSKTIFDYSEELDEDGYPYETINNERKAAFLKEISLSQKMKYYGLVSAQFLVGAISTITTPIAWVGRCLFNIAQGIGYGIYGMGEYMSKALKQKTLFPVSPLTRPSVMGKQDHTETPKDAPSAYQVMATSIDTDLPRGSIFLRGETMIYKTRSSGDKTLEELEKCLISQIDCIFPYLVMKCLALDQSSPMSVTSVDQARAKVRSQNLFKQWYEENYRGHHVPSVKDSVSAYELLRLVQAKAEQIRGDLGLTPISRAGASGGSSLRN